MKRRSSAALPSWLWRLLIAMVLTQVAAFLVRPALTYRALELGADDLLVGLLVAIYAFLPALLAVPLGQYSDRRRPAPVFGAGAILLGVGSAGLAVADSLVTVAVATVALGVGAMAIMVGAQSIVARVSAEADLDRDFGLTSAAASIGQMLGPLGTGWMLTGKDNASGTALAFAVGAGLCAIALAFTFGYPDRPGPSSSTQAPLRRMETVALLRIPGMPGAMIASIALLATVDLLVAYLPLIGERVGISPGVVGILLGLRAAASVSSRIMLAVLTRRFSRTGLITTSTFVTALLVPVIPFTSNPWLLGALLVVLGFFLGLGQPLTMTLITTAVPARSRGAALAIRMLGNKAGQVAVPATIAAATAAVGVGGGFVLLGALLAAATLGASRAR